MGTVNNSATFNTDIAFCSACGALLPNLPEKGNTISCRACQYVAPIDSYLERETCYTVFFNKRENASKKSKKDEEEEEGPTVERKCPKCGHDKMSYAALQLRSADEGQTVFFTCLKCKYKETKIHNAVQSLSTALRVKICTYLHHGLNKCQQVVQIMYECID